MRPVSALSQDERVLQAQYEVSVPTSFTGRGRHRANNVRGTVSRLHFNNPNSYINSQRDGSETPTTNKSNGGATTGRNRGRTM